MTAAAKLQCERFRTPYHNIKVGKAKEWIENPES